MTPLELRKVDEDEALQAFDLLSRALILAGFGWVVDQVSASFFGAGVPNGDPVARLVIANDRPRVRQLEVLIQAIRTAVLVPAQIAGGLTEGGLGSGVGRRAEPSFDQRPWLLATPFGEPAVRSEQLWPFPTADILRSAEAALRELGI